ncbi:transcriptional regulator [Paenibacillus sp. D9]|uniref:response regulator n=1 Tax=Paenibacillus sp. D9 TaxID=665792 RepID=UPI00061F6CDE|nr:response regulator [Paenibacillus sp. D9]KKC49427.1 transcriptional regulator [Paenibacillus sp. D9]
MYRVLLADDEADVREGLLSEIDWEACGFTVAGTAENGLEALELAQRLEPDVVITDIRMPFVDGMELVRRLKAESPLVKTVILTGYDEFDYARQAVSLSVDEYLLKPFSAASLTELLHKLQTRMELEIAEREDMRKLKEHYHTSLPLLKANFLSSLLHRKLPEPVIRDKARHYGLSLEGEGCSVSVISLDSAAAEAELPAQAVQSLRTSPDVDLKLFAVLNIAGEIWEGREFGTAFIHQDHVVLLGFGKTDESWKERLQNALEHIVRSVEHYLRMPVTIGSGAAKGGLSGIKSSYDEALLALDYRLVPGTGRILFIEDVERRGSSPLLLDELRQQALSRCLKVGTPEELETVLETIFGEIRAEHASSGIQLYLSEVLTTVWRTAQSSDVDMEDVLGAGFQPYAELVRMTGLAEARRWITEMCGAVMGKIAGKRQHAYRDLIEEAMSFTRERIHDSDLSIPMVCSHLHISAGYFCGLFKKEVKLTFLQYVMQLRMERAQELLRTTELKAFEIAERIGFSEPNYFSFCFKKHTGSTPKEYRSRMKDVSPSGQEG